MPIFESTLFLASLLSWCTDNVPEPTETIKLEHVVKLLLIFFNSQAFINWMSDITDEQS